MKLLTGSINRLATMVLAVGMFGCDSAGERSAPRDSETAARSGPLRVAVSNYPVKYFTERVGGEYVETIYLAPPDGDPAFWKPSPQEVRQIQQADLIVINGASYEKWLSTVTLPDSKVVNTSRPFRDQWLKLEEETTHSHGPGGTHSHAGTDFNTWLDPHLASKQAQAIHDALAKRLPAEAQNLQENLAALQKDLEALDVRLQEATAPLRDQPLVASHPVYGYFARRYGLNIESMLWEPETMPSEEQWEELKQRLADHPAKVMIWEGVPTPEIEAKLKEFAVATCPVIPAGNAPEEGDYLSVWLANADRLAAAR